MKQRKMCKALWTLAGLVLLAGCSENERIVEVATEAADRQAQQNNEMADLNHEVAQGKRRMIEADAEARREIIAVHQDLQAERETLSNGFDALEYERKDMADQRGKESLLVLAAQSIGILIVAAIVTSFCLILLTGHNSRDESEATLNELLIHDLTSEHPRLLNEPLGKTAIETDHSPNGSKQ